MFHAPACRSFFYPQVPTSSVLQEFYLKNKYSYESDQSDRIHR